MFEFLCTCLVLISFSGSFSVYLESQDVSILLFYTRIILRICIVTNCVAFSDKVTFLSFSDSLFIVLYFNSSIISYYPGYFHVSLLFSGG